MPRLLLQAFASSSERLPFGFCVMPIVETDAVRKRPKTAATGQTSTRLLLDIEGPHRSSSVRRSIRVYAGDPAGKTVRRHSADPHKKLCMGVVIPACILRPTEGACSGRHPAGEMRKSQPGTVVREGNCDLRFCNELGKRWKLGYLVSVD